MRKIVKMFAPVVLGFALTVSNAIAEPVFKDLDENHWAYAQIKQLADHKVVVGYPDETYRPDEEITRAEFASMVVKALHQDEAEITDIIEFADVAQDNWAWNSVQRAVRFDLIKETQDNMFRPNDSVTRAECLEIVINSLTTEDLTLEEATKIVEAKYIDANTIPEWFIVKAGKAEVLGIVVTIPGEEAKMYAEKPATRAEVAAFLFNMMEQVRLAPNKKLAEVLKPIESEGIVIENVVVKDNVGIIPPGTLIPLVIQDDLNSQSSVVSDVFEAKIPENLITSEKYLLFKEGATVKGLLIDKQKAMLIIRNGKLVLNTRTITTNNDQTAAFVGVTETNPELNIWRKIFKGLKVKYTSGETILVKTLKPIKVDLTNSWIIE
ncbi:S-layer homology domain-containing protein [bacterium]|nr:S-layer homology domain-containing protein [bacterium]